MTSHIQSEAIHQFRTLTLCHQLFHPIALRIDLLAIDKNANLVVVELKRTEDGGHMELQTIRYAAMVSAMTFDQAVEAFGHYLKQRGLENEDPLEKILDFLDWDEPNEDLFAQDVRIVLASAEFSKEITSSVLWLIDHGIEIRCVRLKPYCLDARVLVDAQQIIPLPEAADYQLRVREKARKERQARASNRDFTRFDVQIGDDTKPSMYKRNAIFLICKFLCDKGINPEDITALFDWRPANVWYSVEGTADCTRFAKLASEARAACGANFSSARWFCADDDLAHANGKTYAFSNQWGGKEWHRAMQLLIEKYGHFGINYSPAS